MNKKELLMLLNVLVKTEKTVTGLMIDKSEHDFIVDKIKSETNVIHNKMNNTLKANGVIYLLHNGNSNVNNRKFDNLFIYENLKNCGNIPATNKYLFKYN